MFDIALFGGAFDPICRHHEFMVECLAVHGQNVDGSIGMPTWVMPCFHHRFAKDSRLEAPEHRLNMVERSAESINENWLMFENLPSKALGKEILIPFRWQIENQHDGSTYEAIQSLRKEYPNVNFHIVMGMDNANLVETKWDRGNLLIQECPCIVVKREGEKETATWFNDPMHQVLPFDHSGGSTEFRNAIEQKRFFDAKLKTSSGVWNYIKEHKLYGYKDHG